MKCRFVRTTGVAQMNGPTRREGKREDEGGLPEAMFPNFQPSPQVIMGEVSSRVMLTLILVVGSFV